MRILNSPINAVKRWATAELASWPSARLSSYIEECSQLDKEYSIFIIEIDSDGVRLRPKTDGSYRNPALIERAMLYTRYLGFLKKKHNLPSIPIAIDTNDESSSQYSIPIYSFQRKIGDRNPLLVDVDTLTHNFYKDWDVYDYLSFDSKLDSAIFVGSTTGGNTITHSALTNPFPRLRAYRAFRNEPRVHFRLPAIVQTCNEQVTNALCEEGLGGPTIAWRDQLRHKLMLSIDGNGAALSRPYIALSSNSALVKYNSVHEAWYFRYLIEGEHYLPVDRDEDVLKLVDGDMSRHRRVAEKGRSFALRYLTPQSHHIYTLRIITELAKRLY